MGAAPLVQQVDLLLLLLLLLLVLLVQLTWGQTGGVAAVARPPV